MDNLHKRKSVLAACGTHEDRISNLPDQLIDLILELLPIQDAVGTTILSKKWLHRWTTMPSLVFDEQFAIKYAKNGAFGPHGFMRIVNHVMFFHKGPISKFDLYIPEMLLDSFQEVDQWILTLSRNNVRELILRNSNRRYRLPSFVFSCLELRKLHVLNCILKPSLEFQGFPNLESLRLLRIDFESVEIMINLPQLKQLTIFGCTNTDNLNIKAPKLHNLFVLVAYPHSILPKLFHGQCLTKVTMYSLKAKQGSGQIDKMVFSSMPSILPNMTSFETNGYFLKFCIAEYIPKWIPHTLNRLKCLEFLNINFGDLGQLQPALCMLQNSPFLETLHLRNEQRGIGDIHSDTESTSYCLTQPLNCLQTLLIEFVEGSEQELLFIKLLLDHSPNLKKMRIILGRTVAAHKRHKFAKAVMGFRAKVDILMDTVPLPTKFSWLL